MEMRALGLIEVEGREQRYSRRLAISGNTGEYLYACIGCIRSVYTYPPPFFSPVPLQLLEFLPLKLDGVYHDPGRKRTLHHPYATKTTYESLSPPWVLSTYLIPRTTATPSLNRNGNVGGSRRPDTLPLIHYAPLKGVG